MPAKKKATAKKTASVKFDAKTEIEGLDERIDIIIGRLEKLEITVNAIRRENKSKGVPLP